MRECTENRHRSHAASLPISSICRPASVMGMQCFSLAKPTVNIADVARNASKAHTPPTLVYAYHIKQVRFNTETHTNWQGPLDCTGHANTLLNHACSLGSRWIRTPMLSVHTHTPHSPQRSLSWPANPTPPTTTSVQSVCTSISFLHFISLPYPISIPTRRSRSQEMGYNLTFTTPLCKFPLVPSH